MPLMISRLLFLLVAMTTSAVALEMPNIFSDGMVLQRQAPVKIWGKAEPGASVQIKFAGQEVEAQTDSNGNWSAVLKPMEASFEERELSVQSGEKSKKFQDVLVGEVWLCSGQSNMQWPINKSTDGDIAKLGANDKYLRLYKVGFGTSTEPQFSSRSRWMKDTPTHAGTFSAVAYFFGRDLRKVLDVPVGLIQSAVGGTPVIAWTRQEAFTNFPPLQEKEKEWEADLATFDDKLAAWKEDYQQWLQKKGISEEDYVKHKRQGAPRKPEGADSPHRPASLANAMIAPVAPYSVRGAIWYQGEADARWEPQDYGKRLGVMIQDWRQWWEMPEMPFGIVQLANLGVPKAKPSDDPWPKLRESQRRLAQSDPNVGMAVAIDIGEENDIHPTNKAAVAHRLARWALADVYQKLPLAGGPEVVSATAEGESIVLNFDQVGGGLHSIDAKQLKGFTVEDANGRFRNVPAKIVGKEKVRLSTKGITQPKRVRYAWQSNPVDASLGNKERLPASPFEIAVTE